MVLNHETSAGRSAAAPHNWPTEAPIALDRHRATLLLFAHPHCPCTRATLGELNRLLGKYPNRVATHIFFVKPEKAPSDWLHTSLWRSAASMRGVTIHTDRCGTQARLFGAQTSGYVVFYSPEGQLLFKGGITAGRGHAGDNAGLSTIFSLLSGGNPALTQTPVYGCALTDFDSPETTTVCTK